LNSELLSLYQQI